MSLSLPPLKALRAFECAARTGSYVEAADELGVTPAAVSQQVRKLEAYYDRQLFTRYNNRILLTDAGIRIYMTLGPPLQELAQKNTQLLGAPGSASLVVSVLPSLAQTWFTRQLSRYTRLNPLGSVQTRVEEDPVDFVKDRIDLRITYGNQLYRDFERRLLFQDVVLPMCSPAFAESQSLTAASLSSLPDSLFIHVDWGVNYASHPGWSDWFQLNGIERKPVVTRGQRVSMSSVALDYAASGLGVVLGQRELAQVHLQQEKLVVVSESSLPLGQAYYAVYAHATQRRSQIEQLIDPESDAGTPDRG